MQFEEHLRRQQREVDRIRVEQALPPRGTVTLGIDASSIFDDEYEDKDGSPISSWQNFLLTLRDVKKNRFAVRHRVQASFSLFDSVVRTGNLPPIESRPKAQSQMGVVPGAPITLQICCEEPVVGCC